MDKRSTFLVWISAAHPRDSVPWQRTGQNDEHLLEEQGGSALEIPHVAQDNATLIRNESSIGRADHMPRTAFTRIPANNFWQKKGGNDANWTWNHAAGHGDNLGAERIGTGA